MADFYIDAGELRARLQILHFCEVSPDHFAWVPQGETRASLIWSDKRSIFSQKGLGVQGADIILRKQVISMQHALLHEGQYLLPTSILPRGARHLALGAARVMPVACRAQRFENSLGAGNRPQSAQVLDLHFPAVLTEKYLGYAREEAHAALSDTRILVSPKAIILREGDLLHVSEGAAQGDYAVQLCYLTDEHRNEYEITRRRDV